MNKTTIKIKLGKRSYPVVVGEGLLAAAGAKLRKILPDCHRAILISDSNVEKLFGTQVRKSLEASGFNTSSFQIPAGEQSKQFSNLGALLEEILSAGIDRNSVVIALGGGVVGDISGFAASILLRGVPYVQIPTTLLAQVDSSVGGKTAVNSRNGKNLIGSIYQPVLVMADTASLKNLPEREILAGYAEIVKYGVLGDARFFSFLEKSAAAILAHDKTAMHEAVAHCVRQKAVIVAADESENGARALLNLGHTFGHAIENWFGYDGRLLHGEAVAVGMCQAAHLSYRLGYLQKPDIVRIKNHLRAVGLPIKLADLAAQPDINFLVKAMYKDKKAAAGKLNFVLLHGIGDAFIARDIGEPDIIAAILENEK